MSVIRQMKVLVLVSVIGICFTPINAMAGFVVTQNAKVKMLTPRSDTFVTVVLESGYINPNRCPANNGIPNDNTADNVELSVVTGSSGVNTNAYDLSVAIIMAATFNDDSLNFYISDSDCHASRPVIQFIELVR